MIIKLFSGFSKRENSTKQPTGGTEYNVVLKNDCSLVEPSVILHSSSRPTANYAYISDMERYYYIDDIVNLSKDIWEIKMHSDVLATFKTQIGAASLYILRAAGAYDGNIVDNYYPVKVSKTNVRNTINSLVNAGGTSAYANVNNGCFVLGIAGATSGLPVDAAYGSVSYYAFNRSSLSQLIHDILDDNFLLNGGFVDYSDLSIQLQKSIVDPLQFIKSCIWFPLAYPDEIGGTAAGQLYAFGMELTVNHRQITSNPPQKVLTASVTIPKHPQAATRGNYLNCEPFSRYQLLIPPFGNFELDSTAISQGTSLSITIYLDLLTGAGTLRVAGEGDGQYLINAKAQVGVPINLTQVTHDYVGGITGVTSAAASAGAALATGNPLGIINGALSAIGSAVNAYKPIVTSMGSNGGYTDLTGKPTLAAQFYDVANEDNTNFGRPLCQVRQINTLSGYILVKEGDVEIPGYGSEQMIVKNYLEGGFYYE